MEEGKVRQGHRKGRGTQDGETEEEIERKKGKNKRWKRGWKDVGWGWGRLGESKNRKPFMSAWIAGQRPLPVTCWHISLLFDCTARNFPFKHTIRSKAKTEWMNAQGKGTGCISLSKIHNALLKFSI